MERDKESDIFEYIMRLVLLSMVEMLCHLQEYARAELSSVVLSDNSSEIWFSLSRPMVSIHVIRILGVDRTLNANYGPTCRSDLIVSDKYL